MNGTRKRATLRRIRILSESVNKDNVVENARKASRLAGTLEDDELTPLERFAVRGQIEMLVHLMDAHGFIK